MGAAEIDNDDRVFADYIRLISRGQADNLAGPGLELGLAGRDDADAAGRVVEQVRRLVPSRRGVQPAGIMGTPAGFKDQPVDEDAPDVYPLQSSFVEGIDLVGLAKVLSLITWREGRLLPCCSSK